MDDGTVGFRHVHRIDELLVALLVPVAHVVMARRRRHEHPLGDGQVGILKGEGELTRSRARRLVGLIEEAQIERWLTRPSPFRRHGPTGRSRRRPARPLTACPGMSDVFRVGADGKVEIRLIDDVLILSAATVGSEQTARNLGRSQRVCFSHSCRVCRTSDSEGTRTRTRWASRRSASQSAVSVLPVPQAMTVGDPVVVLETRQDGVQRLGLMRSGRPPLERNHGALQPFVDDCQIICGQPVEVRPTDAEEVLPVGDNLQNLVAVHEQDLQISAVGEADERAELSPCLWLSLRVLNFT